MLSRLSSVLRIEKYCRLSCFPIVAITVKLSFLIDLWKIYETFEFLGSIEPASENEECIFDGL